MPIYKLIDKTRKPIYYSAVAAIILSTVGLLAILFPGIIESTPLKITLTVIFGVLIISGYLILGNPGYYMKEIGHISFQFEGIQIEVDGQNQRYAIDEIIEFEFDIKGFKGQNTKSVFEAMLAIINLKSETGLKNYFTFRTTDSKQRLELMIPNHNKWRQLKEVEKNYIIKKASS